MVMISFVDSRAGPFWNFTLLYVAKGYWANIHQIVPFSSKTNIENGKRKNVLYKILPYALIIRLAQKYLRFFLNY